MKKIQWTKIRNEYAKKNTYITRQTKTIKILGIGAVVILMMTMIPTICALYAPPGHRDIRPSLVETVIEYHKGRKPTGKQITEILDLD